MSQNWEFNLEKQVTWEDLPKTSDRIQKHRIISLQNAYGKGRWGSLQRRLPQ
jgi:hypothetical protein